METALFTLGKKFTETCQKNGDRTALQVHTIGDNYHRYTYREILEGAERIAGWLMNQQVKKQDRVAIILENSPQWVMIYFGIMLAGAVAVPLDPQMGRETLFTLLEDSQAKVAFISEKLKSVFDIIYNGLSSLKTMVLLSLEESHLHSSLVEDKYLSFGGIINQIPVREISFPAIELDEAASILYTSGTTAVAKGVELTHRNFSANFSSIKNLNLCSCEDNLISILPFFHAYAFMATLVFPLFLGAKITFPSSLKSEELLSCMRNSGVTILIGVPELFYNIHRAITDKINNLSAFKKILLRQVVAGASSLRGIFKINLSKIMLKDIHSRFGDKLRYLISGGARLEPKVAYDLESLGFTILEGYGLTETSPIATFNPASKPKIGSVGKPIEGVEIKIINADSYEVGEVAIRGQNVMKGYYKLPEETRKVMRGGWFYSGDLGYLDKEGYLHLTGRSKEVIVLSSGKNIYPEEIEEYYGQSRFIKEICMEGISQDNSVVLKAVIVPSLEYFQEMNLGDIRGKIKWDLENYSKNLPSYKRIFGFVITKDPLPRTRLGKVKRYEVRERYKNELLGERTEHREYAPTAEESRIIQSEIGGKVINYLVKSLNLKTMPHLSDHLELDLGIDSLARVDLIVGLEEIFKISLPDTFLTEISSVQDLIGRVEEVVYQKYTGTPEERTLPWKEILNRRPRKEVLEKIGLEPGLINKFLTWLVIKALFMVFKLFFALKIKGRKFIPVKGPYIFCCNHASYLDAFIVLASMPFKVELKLYFIGAREIFHHASVRWAIKLARLIPIDPTSELLSAMEVSGYLLRQGKILCIFPEGQRSIDGKIGEFKKGVGILAEELKVPLVPVAIKGSYKAWGRAVKFPRPHPVEISFGKALDYKEFTPLETRFLTGFTKPSKDTTIDNYSFITEIIKKEVVGLLSRND